MIFKKKEKYTTIKNIFKIHPLVYVFAVLSILIGTYKDFFIISTLIVIHECGHFSMAKLLHIKTDSIKIYPLGGITKFDMDISESYQKELWILIMGPIFQIIAYHILILFNRDIELIKSYHYGILFFNLLPIYPLDGGKILQVLLSLLIPYKKAFKASILVGYITTVILLFTSERITLNVLLIYIVLLMLIRKEDLKKNLYFHKFLLERLLKNYSFKRSKVIHKIEEFYRYQKNIIKEHNILYTEKDYLSQKYKNF